MEEILIQSLTSPQDDVDVDLLYLEEMNEQDDKKFVEEVMRPFFEQVFYDLSIRSISKTR